MNGWIKLHTKLLDWGWYTDVPVMKLWVHILLRANWKEIEWQGEVIPKGSFVTSTARLAIETGLTDKQVRLALNKLEKTGEITTDRSNKHTIISVEKWEQYQVSHDEEGKQTDMQRDTQRVSERATNEEYKKRRREEYNNKPPFIPPTVAEVREYCDSRKNSVDPNEFVDFYTSKNWMIGKNKMVDWKAAVRTWERSSKDSKSEERKMVYTQPWKNSDQPIS